MDVLAFTAGNTTSLTRQVTMVYTPTSAVVIAKEVGGLGVWRRAAPCCAHCDSQAQALADMNVS